MDIESQYIRALARHGYSSDTAQLRAVHALERVRQQLAAQPSADGWLRRLLRQMTPAGPTAMPVRGAYLWGGVGRGKTFVMDVFFDAVPVTRKRRYHFHRLMYRVHKQMKALRGQQDPLATVAAELADQARLLCFDEFYVTDIGDAMILGRLLDHLFRRGVTLVATSNIPPEELYKDGLQRRQFLPAIELIRQHTEIVHVESPHDYRLRLLEQVEAWHSPLDETAERILTDCFGTMATDATPEAQSIEILGREIPMRGRADAVAWFDYAALCDGPRSQDDYIELARVFQTVLLSGVPVLDGDSDNQARRFIALIDEFYERKVKLIVTAAAPIERIYQGERLQQAFLRTASRLHEMQSQHYLGLPHLP